MRLIKFSRIYLVLILGILYFPIVIAVGASFNDSSSSISWDGFSLKWFTELFQDRSLKDALINSIIVSFSACISAATIGTMAAIGIHKRQNKFNISIETISLLPIMIPEIILGMALLALFTFVRLPFGLLTLILAHMTFCIPYVYMTVKARLQQLDTSLEEAGKDLGASGIRCFWDIIFPDLLPGILSGMLLAFAMSFDDVIISIFVTGTTVNTLPIQIYTRVKAGITPEINALITLMLLVIIVCVTIFIVIKGIVNKRREV